MLVLVKLIVICLLTEKKSFKFKADNKNVNFTTQLCLGSIFNGFSASASREVSLNGNMYDFSVDYSSIDAFDILNIHMYLMAKNNIKWCSALLNKCSLYCWPNKMHVFKWW